ncbi:hypothetical protein [Streptomyces sp. NPDC003393]
MLHQETGRFDAFGARGSFEGPGQRGEQAGHRAMCVYCELSLQRSELPTSVGSSAIGRTAAVVGTVVVGDGS